MPDFERVFDELQLYLSETPEERARVEGYIAGKKYARKEIAYPKRRKTPSFRSGI
jgi:hypothetical protein